MEYVKDFHNNVHRVREFVTRDLREFFLQHYGTVDREELWDEHGISFTIHDITFDELNQVEELAYVLRLGVYEDATHHYLHLPTMQWAVKGHAVMFDSVGAVIAYQKMQGIR